MAPLGALLAVGLVLWAIAIWSSLSFTYPKLAFRIENLLQLRSVELSFIGLFIHKAAGFVGLLVAFGLPLSYGLPPSILLAPLLGAIVPPLYFYRTRGVFVVQNLDGEIVERPTVSWDELR